MTTYIKLYTFKNQGHARDSQADLATMMQTAQTMGGRIVNYYVTQGRYDAVAVEEWPDQDAAMAFSLAVAQTDDARSETLVAFDRKDVQRILAEWPLAISVS
jgi:uncharacterized protein with GYD domain